MRRLIVCCMLAATVLPAAHALAADPKVFLSWHAPYGSPRAADTLLVACGDSAGSDTLFLAFVTGRKFVNLFGLEATLYFHAAPGDTLGPSWSFWGGTKNSRNIQVQFLSDSSAGCVTPWPSPGFGIPNYDRTSAQGRLRVVFAISQDRAAPIRDSTMYCFARVILPRAPAGTPQCDQPVCIEWAAAGLAFAGADVPAQAGRGGNRFVSLNSAGGRVCREFRTGPRPWSPKLPGAR